MSLYDDQCFGEFRQIEPDLRRFFAKMAVECPYGLPHDALFYQALFSTMSERLMELFLAAGYRRNGNCLYTMHCPDCRACVPIRLDVREISYNRNQRRAIAKNQDVAVVFGPYETSDENLTLCDKFLKKRYPHKSNDSRSYYNGFFLNRIIPGMEVRYRLDDRLIGNCMVDVGTNWMNAVYFYFDPDLGSRSLGTFNITTLVRTCLDLDISYLYLGYHIKEVSAMNYKARFNPHYLLKNWCWQRQGGV